MSAFVIMLVKSFLFYLFPSFTIRILQILVLITSDKLLEKLF